MLKRLAPFIAILLAFSIAASADAAQRQRRAKPEPPPPPPQFKVDVTTRTMALTKLASGLPNSTSIGKFVGDCALLDAYNTIKPLILYPGDAFLGIRPEDYMAVFATEAAAAGYALATSQQGNLFAAQDATRPELEVGAGITALTADGCAGNVLGFTSNEVKTSITIDWQVFGPLEKQLLFRATGSGQAEVKNREYSNALVVEATRAAFREDARNILADTNFVSAVKDPKGGPPANSDSLFPEATSSAPATPTQIPQLALRTTDFRTQVNELRQQVVTILTPRGTGSGFYVSNNLLLTNQHVIDGYTNVKIKFFGGREIDGRVSSSNGRRDIALIQTESQPVAGLPLRLEPPPETSPVYVIGSPLGKEQEGSISAGIVSGFRNLDFGPMIQSDVGVTFGNSGGPMFDDKGNVIALVDIGLPDDNRNPTQVNLFIPIADALKVLQIDFAPTAAAVK